MKKGFVKRIILHVLRDYGPLHLYGIIKKIRELTFDGYIPSTGVIYPTLRSLEEEGLIKIEIRDKKIYKISEKGLLAISLDPPIYHLLKEMINAKYPYKKLYEISLLIRDNWVSLSKERREMVEDILKDTAQRIHNVIEKK